VAAGEEGCGGECGCVGRRWWWWCVAANGGSGEGCGGGRTVGFYFAQYVSDYFAVVS